MHDQRDQVGAKGRARRHPYRGWRAEATAAVRAHPAMTMDAGDHWANRRQLDVIISMKADLISCGQCVITVRAAFCNTGDDPVRMGSKRPKHPGTSRSLFRRAALGAVGLAPL